MKTKQINMKLTRENTALDLSKLTEGELREISKLTQLSILDASCKLSKQAVGCYYTHRYAIDGTTLISFDHFKSIHFTEQEDKPTYEELVEALRDCFYFIEELNNHGITNWSENSKVKQLLERIK